MQGLDLIGGSFVACGLADAGYACDPRLARARQWLRSCQQHEPFPVYGTPPGGWGWEGPRGWPNFLDSANVLSALTVGDEPDEHLRHGLRWLESRQDRKGSWGTFVPDTTLSNYGPCPYVTARCVEVLIDSAQPATTPGSSKPWIGCSPTSGQTARTTPCGTGGTPGTAVALVAFARSGIADHPVARRAREALLRSQLADGSWGPGKTGVLGDDPSVGTVEETAWALRALLAAGVPADDDRLRRAADWITTAQQPGGLWQASPVYMHIRNFAYYVDGLIVNGLALKALGGYRAALAADRGDQREQS